VNAGPQGRIVACGTGATGAIDKLQQILGVALPPATRRVLGDELREFLGAERFEEFRAFQQSHQPVVFVGPYEHHSNEVTWRQGLATVVEVNLAPDGGVDLAHLESLLADPQYQAACASARSPRPRTSPACARRCPRSHACCTVTARTPASTTPRAGPTSRST